MNTKKHAVQKRQHNNRAIFIIERELREAMEDATTYTRSGHYARCQQALQRAERLRREYNDAMSDIHFDMDNRNMDKAERSFFGKILNLSLNEADLAIYHIEMFFAYMSERGYKPVPEWDRRKGELLRAVKGYREFVSYFFKQSDLRVSSELNFMNLLDRTVDTVFTDREKVYYDVYDVKAANLKKEE